MCWCWTNWVENWLSNGDDHPYIPICYFYIRMLMIPVPGCCCNIFLLSFSIYCLLCSPLLSFSLLDSMRHTNVRCTLYPAPQAQIFNIISKASEKRSHITYAWYNWRSKIWLNLESINLFMIYVILNNPKTCSLSVYS